MKKEHSDGDVFIALPAGQEEARTRWGTHASGTAFDRKKTPYLTEQAQQFIAQQALCVIAGLGPERDLCGMLVMEQLGFVHILDTHTCLLQLHRQHASSRIVQGVAYSQSADRPSAHLGLFFISHLTRERLCVQGTAELLADNLPDLFSWTSSPQEYTWIRLSVQQVFFHCPKYIRTRVAGLTAPSAPRSGQMWQFQDGVEGSQTLLSEPMQAFIAQQRLCFLCTVGQHGHCAVNHRGGAPGFLVTVSPSATAPGGLVLLPDYTGNGAFEAIGNILETGRASLVIPDYTAQQALCVSGPACVLEPGDVVAELAKDCIGAERIIALSVQRVEVQAGNWGATLAYERTRAETILMTDNL